MNENVKKKGFKDLLREVIVPKMELVSAIMILCALGFKFMNGEAYLLVLSIALSSLAVTYYLNAFVYSEGGTGLLDIISIRIGFIASSVVIVGIMFVFLALKGGNMMITIGLSTLSVAVIITLYNFIKSGSQFHKKLLARFAVVLACGIAIYMS